MSELVSMGNSLNSIFMHLVEEYTLNSTYNEVAFNENLAIMKENICTKYTYSPINTLALMKSHI